MEFEYWKDGARDDPEGFRKEIPRFGGGWRGFRRRVCLMSWQVVIS